MLSFDRQFNRKSNVIQLCDYFSRYDMYNFQSWYNSMQVMSTNEMKSFSSMLYQKLCLKANSIFFHLICMANIYYMYELDDLKVIFQRKHLRNISI